MTRPGRVQVYRYARESWAGKFYGPGWRWRYYAINGVQVGASGEGYSRLRDLARNLELCFPGYRLLDQNGRLQGPDWWLYGLEATCPEAYQALPEDITLGIGMRGVRIRVQVPAGVNLSSRR